ncbi:glycosyltransferase family 4 protein [Komagataeibacter rhaeticus]|nr:glycosyltransferase family 4 protein [Komagataeibacter rhaeticus]
MADRVVAVNDAEARLLHGAGFDNVSVLGHMQVPRPTGPGWAARRDILFLGAVHDMAAPNLDSLAWFSGAVLPLLVDRLGPGIRFGVCGHVNPRVDLGPLRRHPNVNLLGRVADTAPVYDHHRVFVAPTRFAAGIAYKLHEAAANGLPVVGSPAVPPSRVAGRAGHALRRRDRPGRLCRAGGPPLSGSGAVGYGA